MTAIKEPRTALGETAIQSRRDPNEKGAVPETAEGGARPQTGIVSCKTVYAIAAAAIVAGAFVGFLSLSMQVEAHARVSAVKGDRADMRPLARACSQNAWPYFEASCLRDTRNPFGQAREVRVIASMR